MTQNHQWGRHLPVAQVQISHPTRDLNAIRRFYGNGLGLVEIEHDGLAIDYPSVFFGLPSLAYHLAFIQTPPNISTISFPNLHSLVFYFHDKEAIGRLVVRLGAQGYFPMSPDTAHWPTSGVTIYDPDGRHIILAEQEGPS